MSTPTQNVLLARCSLALAIVASGCASWSADPSEVQDVTWTAVEINGHPVLSPPPGVLLSNGSLFGDSGCNSFSGEYSVVVNEISFQGGVLHQTWCAEPNAAQEEDFVSAFRSTATYEVDGNTMTLRAPDTELVFARSTTDLPP